jgi:Arc/MetJ-type ribon-helix-helix transcriptional regulator
MKDYIHARLGADERSVLQELKRTTGRSESDLVRQGLRLVAAEERRRRSALDLAGPSVGKFATGLRDLSINRKHLDGFGE